MITIELLPSSKRFCLALHINEEHKGELHYSIFSRKPAFLKSYEDAATFQAKFNELEYKGALRYALRRLMLKAQPSSELKKSLKDHYVSTEIIDKVIQECQRLGYLNDSQWYSSYAESLVRKNYGPKIILMKLRAKGLSEQKANLLMANIGLNTDPKSQILHLINTKYRTRDLSDEKTRQKVISALYRKGFSFEDILSVVKTEE